MRTSTATATGDAEAWTGRAYVIWDGQVQTAALLMTDTIAKTAWAGLDAATAAAAVSVAAAVAAIVAVAAAVAAAAAAAVAASVALAMAATVAAAAAVELAVFLARTASLVVDVWCVSKTLTLPSVRHRVTQSSIALATGDAEAWTGHAYAI